jgi:hypothetical protein
MTAPDKHAQVRELFDQISASWPHTDRLDLPEMADVLDDLPQFPDQIPDVDPVQLTDHAKRVLAAIGEHQHGKPRGRRKSASESASERHPAGPAIDVRSLDRKPRCA